MASRKLPALLALAGAALAVVLFLILEDDGGDGDGPAATTAGATSTEASAGTSGEDRAAKPKKKPPEPKLPTLEIKGGKPVGGVQELSFRSGRRAEFEVITDAADELHFHGYDLYVDIAPKKPTKVSFDADIEGLFELESHSTGELYAEISVVPS